MLKFILRFIYNHLNIRRMWTECEREYYYERGGEFKDNETGRYTCVTNVDSPIKI